MPLRTKSKIELNHYYDSVDEPEGEFNLDNYHLFVTVFKINYFLDNHGPI